MVEFRSEVDVVPSQERLPDPGGEFCGASQPPMLDQPYLAACLREGLTAPKLLQMADLFELRMEEDHLAMLAALEAGNLDGVGAGAHRLKGSAGSLGLQGIRACAAGIEEAAKAGRQAACRSALAALPAVCADVLRAFRDHLGS